MRAVTVIGREAADRVYLAARPREACSDGKRWLLDRFAGNRGACIVIELTNQVGVIVALDDSYPGGWDAFLADTGNLKVQA